MNEHRNNPSAVGRPYEALQGSLRRKGGATTCMIKALNPNNPAGDAAKSCCWRWAPDPKLLSPSPLAHCFQRWIQQSGNTRMVETPIHCSFNRPLVSAGTSQDLHVWERWALHFLPYFPICTVPMPGKTSLLVPWWDVAKIPHFTMILIPIS